MSIQPNKVKKDLAQLLNIKSGKVNRILYKVNVVHFLSAGLSGKTIHQRKADNGQKAYIVSQRCRCVFGVAVPNGSVRTVFELFAGASDDV